MPFVALFLILAGAAAIFFLYPHLRVLAGVVFVFFLVLLGYLVADRWVAGDATAAPLAVSDLVLSDLDLAEGSRFQKVTGRVLNTGDAHLRSFDLRVRMLDCPAVEAEDAACAIIAEDTGTARVDVPAGQVRVFEATLGFSDRTPPKGTLRWQHQVTGVRATP